MIVLFVIIKAGVLHLFMFTIQISEYFKYIIFLSIIIYRLPTTLNNLSKYRDRYFGTINRPTLLLSLFYLIVS